MPRAADQIDLSRCSLSPITAHLSRLAAHAQSVCASVPELHPIRARAWATTRPKDCCFERYELAAATTTGRSRRFAVLNVWWR